MSILRGALPTDGFTIIPNAWLRDSVLSAKAKGILCYLASHREGYELTFAQMRREMRDGEGALRSGCEELEAAGYLVRVRTREESGRLGSYEWVLGETAVQDQTAKSSLADPAWQTQPPKKTTEEKTTKSPSPSARGARLPEDWVPSAEVLAWFVQDLVPGGRWSEASRLSCRRETEKFKDYWLAAAGQNARKLDWDRTWRNWMRRAFEGRTPEAPVSAPPSSKPFVQQADEYKAAKEEREDKIIALMDELMAYAESKHGQVMHGSEARKLVNGWIESGQIDLNAVEIHPDRLNLSVLSLYSGNNVITADETWEVA